MAGKPLSAELIREILRLHNNDKLSNREIARRIHPRVNKETVNRYISFVKTNGLDVVKLIKMNEYELDRVFHKGDPAYTEPRMDVFIRDIPIFEQERKMPGMTVHKMWSNYRKRHFPDFYERTQFRFHLERAGLLPPQKGKDESEPEARDIRALLAIPACTTSFYDLAFRYKTTVHFLVLYLITSGYLRIFPVTSLAINDIVGTVNGILSEIGGIPHVLVTEDLRKACTRPDKSVPAVRNVLKEMASYYMYNPNPLTEKGIMALARTRISSAFNHLNHLLVGLGAFTQRQLLEEVELFQERYNRTRTREEEYSREELFLRDERPFLKPIQKTAYEIVACSKHKVADDGTVQVGKKMETGFYSVPVAYIGKKVTCHLSSETVLVLDKDEIIAEHARVASYRYSIQDGHQREWEASKYNNPRMRIQTAGKLIGILGTWMELYFNETVVSGHRVQECFRRYAHIMHMAYEDKPAMETACNLCVRDQIYTYKGLKEKYELYLNKE